MENPVLLIGIISCGIGILTYIGGIAQKAKNDGRLEQKIDDLKVQIEKLDKHSDRITVLEQSVKSAWIRIDEISLNIKSASELLNEIELRCAKTHAGKQV